MMQRVARIAQGLRAWLLQANAFAGMQRSQWLG